MVTDSQVAVQWLLCRIANLTVDQEDFLMDLKANKHSCQRIPEQRPYPGVFCY